MDGSADYHYPQSPHPNMIATTAAGYPVAATVGYHSGPLPGRMSVPVSSAPMPELQLQMPDLGPGYPISASYGYQPMPHFPQATMSMAPHPMSAPVGRMPTSWEFANFVNDSPVTANPNSAPPTAYPRGSIEVADFVPSAHYH